MSFKTLSETSDRFILTILKVWILGLGEEFLVSLVGSTNILEEDGERLGSTKKINVNSANTSIPNRLNNLQFLESNRAILLKKKHRLPFLYYKNIIEISTFIFNLTISVPISNKYAP